MCYFVKTYLLFESPSVKVTKLGLFHFVSVDKARQSTFFNAECLNHFCLVYRWRNWQESNFTSMNKDFKKLCKACDRMRSRVHFLILSKSMNFFPGQRHFMIDAQKKSPFNVLIDWSSCNASFELCFELPHWCDVMVNKCASWSDDDE